jgi:hypothetical protein
MESMNIGNQSYPIPDGTDMTKYDPVLIWCRAFSVLFGNAELLPPAPISCFQDTVLIPFMERRSVSITYASQYKYGYIIVKAIKCPMLHQKKYSIL